MPSLFWDVLVALACLLSEPVLVRINWSQPGIGLCLVLCSGRVGLIRFVSSSPEERNLVFSLMDRSHSHSFFDTDLILIDSRIYSLLFSFLEFKVSA